MTASITRRDFLNGVALAIGSGLTPTQLLAAAAATAHPPGMLGLRGSTDAASQAAHALRDGQVYDLGPLPVESEVDLLVVGAGISGLAAAYYFRQQQPRTRILLLDNHDDFGGHARRVEMSVDGRLIIGYGGSETIQAPASEWSANALALLSELGVDLRRFETAFDHQLYPGLGLSRGMLFKREAFGVDRLVTGDPTRMVADDIPPDRLNARAARAFIDDFPLDAAARAQLLALYTDNRDVLPGLSATQREERLATLSYRDFLVHCWGLSEQAANTFQKRSHDFFALGIDGIAAMDAWATGYPGFQGMPGEPSWTMPDEPYIHHFPDGNASIARLLVRKLIPAAAAGDSMEDVVTARFDYGQLDLPGARTRLRLNSTVLQLQPRRGGVDVGYWHAGELRRVRARRVVHAGYNMMLPYMLPRMPEPQRKALASGVKAPLVYAKVALRNWHPWVRAGVHEVTNPMGFYSRIKLDYPVSLGSYRCAHDPSEPIGLHLVHVPTPGHTGMDQRTAWRAGRKALQDTPYETFESHLIDELSRMLSGHGFDAQRDVAAISVYRWAHGYAYGANSLYDGDDSDTRLETARQPLGSVTIANSDATGSAYAHAAIDEAKRAVAEALGAE
jgi:spermidine dehydrogenase